MRMEVIGSRYGIHHASYFIAGESERGKRIGVRVRVRGDLEHEESGDDDKHRGQHIAEKMDKQCRKVEVVMVDRGVRVRVSVRVRVRVSVSVGGRRVAAKGRIGGMSDFGRCKVVPCAVTVINASPKHPLLLSSSLPV